MSQETCRHKLPIFRAWGAVERKSVAAAVCQPVGSHVGHAGRCAERIESFSRVQNLWRASLEVRTRELLCASDSDRILTFANHP